jgi:hypothetical protein
MWLPPSHRSARSTRYWTVWMAIDAALAILFAVAAILGDRTWELVFTALFGARFAFDVIALRRDRAS